MAAINRDPDWESGPGLLVLASPVRVLFMNQRAAGFMRRLSAFEENLTTKGPSGNSSLPASLLQFSTELFHLTQARAMRENFDQFEMRCIINTYVEPMRIRGFGLADHREQHRSRVVIFLEEIDAREHSDKTVIRH